MRIKVQYFGIIRLLIAKTHDVFVLPEDSTLETLVQALDKKYGGEVVTQCFHQIFVITSPVEQLPIYLRFPRDKNIPLKDKSCIKLVTGITGG